MVGLLLEQQQQGDNDDDKAHPGGGKGLSSSPKGKSGLGVRGALGLSRCRVTDRHVHIYTYIQV